MDLIALASAMRYTDQRVLSIENQAIKKYTVNFTGSNSAGTRADDAVGMVANVAVDGAVVVNDFDNVSFFDRPICCGDYDANGIFHVNAYRGEPGFALDGSNGNLWYECTPFYWKGDLLTTVSVTGTPCEGYELAPMFPNGTDKVYCPVYWLSMVGGVATSRSGVFPTYNSIDGHMANARTYNNAKAHVETMAARISDYILQLVEFATKDVQNVMKGACNLPYNASHVAVITEAGANRIVVANAYADQFIVGQTIAIGTTLGSGSVCENRIITSITVYDANNKAINFDGAAVDITAGNIISTRAWKTGATDIVVASSGSPVSNTSGKYPCIWRGKVDPWADAFSAICDILIQRAGAGTAEDPYTYTPYYLSDPRKYAAGAITADYVKLNYVIPGVDGYAKTLGYDARYKYARLTDTVGASSTTYLAAYYYYPRSAVCVAFAGGVWSFGRPCSPVCFHCDFAPSYSGVHRLSRLFVTR